MNNMIKATFYRIIKATSTKICMLIVILAAALYFLLAKGIASGWLGEENTGNITALGDAMIIWLVGSLMTGVIICQDFKSKSIHTAIASVGSRYKIIVSYAIVFVIVIVLLTLPYTMISMGCYFMEVDFVGAEKATISIYLGNLFHSKEVSVIKVICLYIVNAFVYMGSLSICIPVAIKIKKPVVITAIGFMLGILVALLSSISNNVAILDFILKLTPYHYMFTTTNLDSSYGELGIAFAVSVLFVVEMTILSYLLFKKEDVK